MDWEARVHETEAKWTQEIVHREAWVPAVRPLVPPVGPELPDKRNAALLVELRHLVDLAILPPKAREAVGTLLWEAIEDENRTVWEWVIMQVRAMTAENGKRSKQVTDVLVTERLQKERVEAIDRLASMGPKVAADEAPAR